MSAVLGLPARHHPHSTLTPRTTALLLTIALALVAAAGGLALAGHPIEAIVAVAALTAVALMTLRIGWAVLVYVALAPFADALKSFGSLSVKSVGALLFVAWLVRLVLDRRPLALRHGVIGGAAVLTVALLASAVLHSHGSAGVVVMVRYLSYLGILVILTDVTTTATPTTGARTTPRRVVEVFWWSCTAAAIVGMVVFLVSGEGRAFGPMADPNDFAFYLVCALPFGIALRRRPLLPRLAYDAAALALLLTIALTFSRGAFVGIAAMVVYGVVAGRLRLRTVLVTLAAFALGATAVVAVDPGLVRSSLEAKQHIAAQNVDDRFVTWSVAAEMTAADPVLGQGPGGFAADSDDYLGPRVTDPAHLDVAHQMYLDVSSELGLVGLGGFVAMMAAGFAGAARGARRGTAARGVEADLAAGVCLSFVGVAVAACFLSEQYYLPVWLLAGLGAVLDPRSRVTRRRRATAAVAGGA
ncbi:O-antigen ligase family protein [Nocardioides sp. BP30]|uniref:O-antigen ligase family protein n=1 Tax=Nocardioides sp. BP30 TaxID=3036374 RepID=UPI0024691C67|nr:O-antigen ligase family protein [Nocardioides sp. BP30]WGL51000.1 O-antigen ligase family protein [Nocardioides sp. BP30]